MKRMKINALMPTSNLTRKYKKREKTTNLFRPFRHLSPMPQRLQPLHQLKQKRRKPPKGSANIKKAKVVTYHMQTVNDERREDGNENICVFSNTELI